MELLNIGPETEKKEYKRSIGELKEGIISIVAILNKHQKGELYFGVKNDGTVIGQEIGEETLRTVSQAIGNHIKPTIYPEISQIELGGRQVVYVKFEGNRRPYIAYNIPRIRVSDEDLVMEQGIYDSMLLQRTDLNKAWESQVSSYTVDDVDINAFKIYMRKAKEAGRIEFDTEDVATVLKKLGLMQGEYLLNAGAAIFCDTGINELQMAKFASNERLTFTDIRRYTGSIIELADKAEKYLIDAMDWRAEITGLTRVEIPEVPVAAVREAIINSFSHRLIESKQSNEIAVFKNRIEIYNYGTFPDNIEPKQFVEGNEAPVRRNPLITRTLYYSKDMENFATGLKRISEACREAGCPLEFQRTPYGFRVVFYRVGYDEFGKSNYKYGQDSARECEGVRESASGYTRVHENKAEYEANYRNMDRKAIDVEKLPYQQAEIYRYIRENGEITAADVEELLHIKRRRANIIISEMIRDNIIKKTGSSNHVKYII